MRIRLRGWALVGLVSALPLSAQQVPASLTLEYALELARANSPVFLQSQNDGVQADWDVKQAYGQFIPTASASTGMSWQGGGETQVGGGITLGDLGFGNAPSYYLSNYGLNVGLNLSLASFLAPSQAKAARSATSQRTRVAEATLVSLVTGAYLEVLRQSEGLRLAQQQLDDSQLSLRLAQGQLEVGAATPIDVGQAEVQVGRSEVAVLQSRNAVTTSRMRLFQSMGVSLESDTELTTTFALSEPTWNLDELNGRAVNANPALASTRYSMDAADIGVKSARSAYFPSLSLSTAWSGFTREATSTDYLISQSQAQVAGQVAQCNASNDLSSRLVQPYPTKDCTQYAFTDAQGQSIIDQNNQFPFNFQKSPLSLRVGLSIPIFQGFTRQRNLEAAKLQRDDIVLQVREQEIALRADLAVALTVVQTAYQSALLEARNRDLAERQLGLARDRYQLGAITFVDLMAAQTIVAQADRDQIGAVFAYHDAVSRLETLVGTPLR